MKEIEFRGIPSNKYMIDKFVYGYLVDEKCIKTEKYGYINVTPETVGQYTGLKDKNGVKIYEGDKLIVLYSTYDGELVVWENKIESILDFEVMRIICYSNEVEVIGNIHEPKGE